MAGTRHSGAQQWSAGSIERHLVRTVGLEYQDLSGCGAKTCPTIHAPDDDPVPRLEAPGAPTVESNCSRSQSRHWVVEVDDVGYRSAWGSPLQ